MFGCLSSLRKRFDGDRCEMRACYSGELQGWAVSNPFLPAVNQIKARRHKEYGHSGGEKQTSN